MNFELIPYSDPTYQPLILPDGVLSFPGGDVRSQTVELIEAGAHQHKGGFYDSDREATLTATVTLAQAKQIDAMIRNAVVLYFDDDIGVYRCVINSAGAVVDSKISIVLWIKERLVSTADYIYPVPIDPWNERTDDTYFQYVYSTNTASELSWLGSAWEPGDGYAVIWFCTAESFYGTPAINPLFIGYQPEKIRITFTPSNPAGLLGTFSIVDQDRSTLFSYPTNDIISGQEIDISSISWGVDRVIHAIIFDAWDNEPDWLITVTKIEFYVST